MRLKLTLLFCLLLGALAWGQLVVVDNRYVVDRVDRDKSQIVVSPADTDTDETKELRGQFVVLIGPHTRVVDGSGKPANWRAFRPGTGLRVQGGLTMGIKIAAQRITVDTPY